VPVPSPPDSTPLSIKIADLGNATPSKQHFTEDIQTRQYRAPEAILGRNDWGTRADVWSVACVIFELLTAEYLFDPHGQGEMFTKDDDHMAQIIELLGDFPLDAKMGGRYSREIFDHTGKSSRKCKFKQRTHITFRGTSLHQNVEAVAFKSCHDREIPFLYLGSGWFMLLP
jgi:serine/threonine protein kinase